MTIIQQVQEKLGLAADGNAGPLTWAAIAAALGIGTVAAAPSLTAAPLESMPVGADGNHDDKWPPSAAIKFFFHKVDQGTHSQDPAIASRICDGRYEGHLGLYHFSSGDDATEQAHHFITRAQGIGFEKGKHAVVLDYEHSALPDAVGTDQKPAQAQEWIDTVEAALGCKVIVYGSDMLSQALAIGAFPKQPLWPARYHSTPPVLPGARKWTFWQNHGLGGEGLEYDDMNLFNGTQEELDSQWPNFTA